MMEPLPSPQSRSSSAITPNVPDMTFSRTLAIRALHRLQHGLSHPPIELVYTPHERWPLPHPSLAPPLPRRPLTVSILDSSFNPPTLAHLALAKSLRPSYFQPHDSVQDDAVDYDARLLLLSVRNADKSLKSSDASYLQRLEMMALLANRVAGDLSNAQSDDGRVVAANEAANVAIGIIDEPTFVGKSSSLLTFLRNRFLSFSSTDPLATIHDIQLTFIVGYDTLERLTLPRYYPSESQMLLSLRKFLSPPPGGDDSRLVCARRSSLPSGSPVTKDTRPQDARLQPMQEFIVSGRVAFIDIEEEVRTSSSTAVRDAISRSGFQSKGWRRHVTTEIATYLERDKLYFESTA